MVGAFLGTSCTVLRHVSSLYVFRILKVNTCNSAYGCNLLTHTTESGHFQSDNIRVDFKLKVSNLKTNTRQCVILLQ